MNSIPDICYVVPTLGRNRTWLKKTLSSIRNQDVQVELRVVAAATADIGDIVKEFNGILILENGKSLSEAINQGFAGLGPNIKYVAWLGDDDILAPKSLETTVSILEKYPKAPFVFGQLRYIDENNVSKWVLRPGRWAVTYARFGHNFIGQPGSLIRKSSFELIGGLDVSLKNSMDQDMFLRLARLGNYRYVPKELASFRIHPGSISSTKGVEDEMSLVSQKYRRKLPIIIDAPCRILLQAMNRILLSAHCRIPNCTTPTWHGKPYYNNS